MRIGLGLGVTSMLLRALIATLENTRADSLIPASAVSGFVELADAIDARLTSLEQNA